MCRSDYFKTVPNKQNKRAVLSLHVFCSNTKRGCDWVGELGNIASHLKSNSGCKFEMVRCSNSCGKAMERQYLAGHVEKECPCRQITCEYCHIKGENQFIEGSHKQKCSKFPVSCPFNCKMKSVPKRYMKGLPLRDCSLSIPQCGM